MTRADNKAADKTEFYEYDESGNLVSKSEYAYTLGTPSGTSKNMTYTYDSAWKDRLTKYSGYGDTMSYVGGNPNNYHGYTLVWEKGRQLKSMTKTGSSLSFEYNANGIRTKKTVNGIVHSYYLNGTNVLLETVENGGEVNVLQYIYDNAGEVSGMKYNGSVYLYEKNLQGDVIRVLDNTGKVVVKYVYNAWGKIEKILDATGADISGDSTHIGNINPIRYRSYYYDRETELYYLQSRYYDPETCRFINADEALVLFENGLLEDAAFTYCCNEPVNDYELEGYFSFKSLIKGVKKTVKKAVATVKSAVKTVAKAISQLGNKIQEGISKLIKLTGNLLKCLKESLLQPGKINLKPFETVIDVVAMAIPGLNSLSIISKSYKSINKKFVQSILQKVSNSFLKLLLQLGISVTLNSIFALLLDNIILQNAHRFLTVGGIICFIVDILDKRVDYWFDYEKFLSMVKR